MKFHRRQLTSLVFFAGSISVFYFLVIGLYVTTYDFFSGLHENFFFVGLMHALLMSSCIIPVVLMPTAKTGSSVSVHAVSILLSFVVVVPTIFAGFYYVLDCIDHPDDMTAIHYYYFSYLTFTTLGYGDALPCEICMPLSVFESLSGLTSLAAVIALKLSIPGAK